MSKTKIPWCGYTINPVKGLCPMACKDDRGKEYCYARRMYKRFKWNPEIRFEPDVFFDLPDKPCRVFVGSTMELFGLWVKPVWLDTIFQICKQQQKKTFIFLTKQPQNLAQWSPLPENCHIGVSVTADGDMTRAVTHLANIKATVRFLSMEPLLGAITMKSHILPVDWIILGSRTQPIRHPEKTWCKEIIEAGEEAGIQIFIKEPLATYLNDHRQEFPKEPK